MRIHVFLCGSHSIEFVVFKDVAFLSIRFTPSFCIYPNDLLVLSESEQD